MVCAASVDKMQCEVRASVASPRWTNVRLSATICVGNVAVVQPENKIGFYRLHPIDTVVVWSIYEVVGDKIAVGRLVGSRTNRFIEYSSSVK
jgi:hypothetical protein